MPNCQIVESGPKSNLSFMPVLAICKFDKDPIKNEFATGQVTLMWIVQSAPKSNLSKIFWLSSLPANLMKIQSKMKSISSRQHFPKSMEPSRAGNSQANSWIGAKIEHVSDFMSLLVICKFDEASIKDQKWSCYHLDNIFHILRLWYILVAMETKVLTRSAPKPNTAKSPPQWWYLWNLIKTGRWPWRYSCTEVWTHAGTDKWALLYYKLTLRVFKQVS